MPSRILLVEDEEHLAAGIRFNLELDGYEVEVIGDGLRALERLVPVGEGGAPGPGFDLVLLDVMLPGLDGFEVVKRMRAAGNYTAVLMLTAKGLPEDVVEGLEAGADDYLPKPFDLDELEARVRALARRAAGPAAPAAAGPALGGLRCDLQSGALYHGEHVLDLPPREATMLRALLMRPGQAVTKERLFEQVFAGEADVQVEAIEVVAYRLRKRLVDTGVQLVTLRGLGYLLKAAA
jgi:two-component system response regulator TctD